MAKGKKDKGNGNNNKVKDSPSTLTLFQKIEAVQIPDVTKVDEKPPFQTTTLWDYPRQSYGKTPKGDNKFQGVTPAFIIWNLVQRYTEPGDLVVDPMAGSGTTIDVCKEEGRRVIGYDLAPRHPDVLHGDARCVPLGDNSVDMIFIDSPYSDNVRYSDHPDCIGRISCEDERFFHELEAVAIEMQRILKPGKVMAWLIGDQWVKKKFTPVGFKLYERLCNYFEPIDVVCVVRRGQSSHTGLWLARTKRFNFYLRGFKYLLIMRKPEPQSKGKKTWARYKPPLDYRTMAPNETVAADEDEAVNP
jgi:SAM-dependent methyltransferase